MSSFETNSNNKNHCMLCPFPSCNGSPIQVEAVEGQEHAVMCVCGKNFDHYWFFCVECDQSRVWTTRRSLNKHTREHHQHNAQQTKSMMEEEIVQDEDAVKEDDRTISFPTRTSAPDIVYSTGNSTQFFEHDFHDKGCHFLVSKAYYNNEAANASIDDLDVEVQMKLAFLVSKLSKSENEELASVIKSVIAHTVAARKRDVENSWKTSLPTSYPDMRSKIIEGPRSILKNLPRPEARMVDDKHAYVSIIDCLADLLGHGFGIDIIGDHAGDRVRYITESPAAQNVLSNGKKKHNMGAVYCTYFLEWYDDLEPNSSIKSNRGGVWIKTITFGAPKEFKNSLHYTYVVGCGPKEVDHEAVESAFLKDVLSLKNEQHLLFSKLFGQPIHVHAELLVTLADQLARRAANYTTAGNGRFGARWGYAADLFALMNNVPACENCIQAAYRGDLSYRCEACTNWSLDVDSALLDCKPPEKYPKDMLPPSEMLRPKRITYDSMKSAMTKASSSVASGDWTAENAKAFLDTEGFNQATIQEIVKRGLNIRILNWYVTVWVTRVFFSFRLGNRSGCYYLHGFPYCISAYEKRNESHFRKLQYEALLMQKNNCPEQFQPFKTPSIFLRGTNISSHIDVLMHLCFLGHTKSCVSLVALFLSCRSCLTAFTNTVQGRLEGIEKLHLKWCKVLPYYGGKLGGWISENFVGLGKIIKWFYSDLIDIAESEIFEEPQTPQSTWNKTDNVGWLRARGLDTSGSAAECSARVAELMTGEPPPLLKDMGLDEEDAARLSVALSAMLARVMVREVVPEQTATDLERSIKVMSQPIVDIMGPRVLPKTFENFPNRSRYSHSLLFFFAGNVKTVYNMGRACNPKRLRSHENFLFCFYIDRFSCQRTTFWKGLFLKKKKSQAG